MQEINFWKNHYSKYKSKMSKIKRNYVKNKEILVLNKISNI